ncbi:NAD-dependent epimerase/dehydratase family protein [Candidatus Halobonum tyrrellensis]|uniref:NAD-dependent epimerase/dehydratase n=1 Tax=Candidatus Halobonum tyrrellensis G22 TaxID=1324957 RepID=V4J398_9EURY|nr:NAD-dependent epimerase/dehydratase family protein [Candidatus Halobonum tyrrellensis]ESP89862.1 NAD-dependent epimerase/dehydratase [Candidatus Halobonum tyrrellensis G22]
MRITLIGGTGHVGTYLVPRLVAAGHDVSVVSRGERDPYHDDAAWEAVETLTLDREAAEERGEFGERILDTDPDAVIDLICFDVESARSLVESLRGEVQQLLHCGTIWVHGPSVAVPTTEDEPRRPFGDYGVQKAEIESYLLDEARRTGFPATVLHPGHISGPGWTPINPQGNLNHDVFERLAAGEEVTLPNLGMETLHHVHADDVAQAFERALDNWSAAVGESFHVVSPKALTLRGYAEAVAGWFGEEANLEFLGWAEWRETVSAEDAEATEDHVRHSPNCSIAKARERLGYEPRYTSERTLKEAVDWLVEEGEIEVPE